MHGDSHSRKGYFPLLQIGMPVQNNYGIYSIGQSGQRSKQTFITCCATGTMLNVYKHDCI